jgi:hypothetical protein
MKKPSRLIILLLFIIFLLKCATALAPLRKAVEVEDDKYERVATVVGIEEKIGADPMSFSRFFIRSWIDKESGNVIHQIYVFYSYSGQNWRFYQRANSQEAQPLELTEIDRDVNCYQYGCTYYETLGVMIADEYLRNHLNGFSIKISARSGHSFIIEVTPEQIKSQLIKIQEYKKSHNL